MQRSEWDNLKPGDYIYWIKRDSAWVVLSRAVRLPPRPRGMAITDRVVRINDWGVTTVAYCLANAGSPNEKSPVIVCDYMPGWYLASELDDRA